MRFDIKNSEIEHLVNEYVHNKQHREMLKARFIDGLTFSELSYKFNLSERQVKKIIYKNGDKLLRIMQELDCI